MGITVLEHLIESKPELEDIILSALVNKLGDTSKKI
jgi:hypothetical protein